MVIAKLKNILFFIVFIFYSRNQQESLSLYNTQSIAFRTPASTLNDCSSLVKNYLEEANTREFYEILNDEFFEHLKDQDKVKDIIYTNYIANPFYARHIEKYTSDESVLEYVRESGYEVPRSEDFLRKVDGLNTDLKSLPNAEVTAYSGRTLDEKSLRVHSEFDRDQFSFHYFLSCSANLNVALGFIDRSNFLYSEKKPYLYKIHTSSGKIISQKSTYEEQEVLFPTTATFKLKDKFSKKAQELLPQYVASSDEFMDQQMNIVELEEVTHNLVQFDFLEVLKTLEKRPFDPKIELKRLIDKDDFKTISENDSDLYDHYGLEASASWLKAAQFIQEHSGDEVLNAEFLKKIHTLAMPQNAYYKGFEKRRIFRDFKNKKITLQEAISWLKKVQKGEVTYSEVNHKTLTGEFRKEEIDYFVFEGNRKNTLGERYFSGEELEGMLANPAFKKQGEPKKIGPNQFMARFHLISPEHIDNILHNLFSSARDALKKAKTDKEYIKNVVILEKMLIAIHPFLDGNGRAIRLLSDALYLKRKLPLPLHPRTDDFYRPTADLLEETYTLMRDYADAYQKVLKDKKE